MITDMSRMFQADPIIGASNAVVIIPSTFYYIMGEKSGDEIILDMAESLRQAGVINFHFQCASTYGTLVEVFPEGVPTVKEVLERKERMLKHLR